MFATHSLAPSKHGYEASNNNTPSDQTLHQYRNVYSRSGYKFKPNGYFSTHMFKVEEDRTSATCRYLGNGHNKLATQLNTKGG